MEPLNNMLAHRGCCLHPASCHLVKLFGAGHKEKLLIECSGKLSMLREIPVQFPFMHCNFFLSNRSLKITLIKTHFLLEKKKCLSFQSWLPSSVLWLGQHLPAHPSRVMVNTFQTQLLVL